MKKYIAYIYIIGLAVLIFASCDDKDIMLFDTEKSGINFDTFSSDYAFSKTLKTIDTLDIPFSINGMASDKIRHANFTVWADSTSALDNEYEIISAIVEPDMITGFLKIMVTKNDLDSIPDRRIWLKASAGKDFEAGIYTMSNHQLTLTDRFPRPHNWYPGSRITKYVLGEYSTSYYKWIISATGETQFPYGEVIPGYNNDQKWDYYYKEKWKLRLKDLLKEYNASIAPDFLVHSDGRLEGEPVVVGVYKR